MNTILRETKYFHTLAKREENILTIAGRDAMIVGVGRATITLPIGYTDYNQGSFIIS
jgi:hypothetical protein